MSEIAGFKSCRLKAARLSRKQNQPSSLLCLSWAQGMALFDICKRNVFRSNDLVEWVQNAIRPRGPGQVSSSIVNSSHGPGPGRHFGTVRQQKVALSVLVRCAVDVLSLFHSTAKARWRVSTSPLWSVSVFFISSSPTDAEIMAPNHQFVAPIRPQVCF